MIIAMPWLPPTHDSSRTACRPLEAVDQRRPMADGDGAVDVELAEVFAGIT